jgi:hypothetical protein
MKIIWLLCCMGFLAACATYHAARVSCDSNLRPINAVIPAAGAPRADAASIKSLDGAS